MPEDARKCPRCPEAKGPSNVSVHTTSEEFKRNNHRSLSLDLCQLRKTRAGKYRDNRVRHYRFRKASFPKCFPSTLKRKASVFGFSGLKSVLKKLHFRDGLVWTVSLTVQIKLRFQISPA